MLQRFLVVLGVLNLVAIIVLSVVVVKGRERVVYVDSRKLMDRYKGMEDARAAYQRKAAGWQANIDTLANEVKRDMQTYEAEQRSLTGKERMARQEIIRNKQKQFTDYQQAVNSQAADANTKMTDDIVAQVNVYLKKYGETKGYTVILGATEFGNLAYADASLDVTDDVLKGLNAEYSGR